MAVSLDMIAYQRVILALTEEQTAALCRLCSVQERQLLHYLYADCIKHRKPFTASGAAKACRIPLLTLIERTWPSLRAKVDAVQKEVKS